MRAIQLALACVAVLIATPVPSEAGIITFDTSSDLTDNFIHDVINGDSFTQWGSGYAPGRGFPGSDWSVAHFLTSINGDSIQFKSGPIFLYTFDISLQSFASGCGVSEAVDAGFDDHLRLYDQNLVPIAKTTLLIEPMGALTTLTFATPGVSAILVGQRGNDGTGTGGWWPNIDIVPVDATAAVPEPSSLALFSIGACVAGVGVARRRRREKQEAATS